MLEVLFGFFFDTLAVLVVASGVFRALRVVFRRVFDVASGRLLVVLLRFFLLVIGSRLGVFGVVERKFGLDVVEVANLGQCRQIVETLETEVVEERLGRSQQFGLARHVAMTHYLDPLAFLERLQHIGTERNAADLLDLASGDWLTVGNDGQSFQQRTRVARRFLGPQSRDDRHQFLANLQAIAAGHFDQFGGATGQLRIEQCQGFPDRAMAGLFVFAEQAVELVQGQRLAGREQRAFKPDLEFFRFHRIQVPWMIVYSAVACSAPGARR